MPGTVVKGVAGAGLRAAWRRDGMTRDETTWTWWTLPPPISGCLARRYHRHPPLSSRPCWTSRNARSRSGLRRPAGCLLAASGHTPGSARTSPAPVDQRSCGPGGADAATYSSRTLRSMVGLPATCACSRRSVFTEARPGCKAVQHRLRCLVRRLRIGRITGCHGGGVMPEPPLVRLTHDQAVSWFAGLSGIHSIRTVVASSERRPCWWSRMAWLRRRRVSGAGVPLAL